MLQKGFFGGVGEGVLVPYYYSVYTVHRGLYVAILCIINYILQPDHWKGMEQNFDIPNPLYNEAISKVALWGLSLYSEFSTWGNVLIC